MEDYKQKALCYAEKHGIYEYDVNGKYMEYWSMYDEGFYFFRVNIDTEDRRLEAIISWHKEDEIPIPAFLTTEDGATRYNYLVG